MNKYLLFLLVGCHACIAATADPHSVDQAPSFQEVLDGFQNLSEDTVRIGVLQEMGETIGFRSGMVWEAQNIARVLQKRELDLDRIFMFGSLITQQNTLPPVIVEAQDVASISPEQFRTANKVYTIIKPEEFVSVPPTWRDYLFTGLQLKSELIYPGEDAKPKNSAEREAWEKAVSKGWEDGTKQASNILEENFNRLIRDYTGMLRFSSLLKQGMISSTQVASTTHTVAPESSVDKLTIGEQHRTIIKKSEFQVNPEKWRPVITKDIQSPQPTYNYGGR